MAKKVRKFHVTVKPVRFDGLPAIQGNETTAKKNLSAMVELKWKGPVTGFGLGFVPFYRSNRPVNYTSSKPITMGVSYVEWEEEFDRVCCIVGPWNLSFNIFYGENIDSKNKKALIGKASLDLSELATKLDSPVERKLLIRSKGSLLSREATLVVKVTFSEVRSEPNDFRQLGHISIDSAISTKMTNRRGERTDLDSSSSATTESSSGEGSPIVEIESSPSSSEENQFEPVHKAGFNWWKRRRLSFSVTRRREPKENDITKISTKTSNTESIKPETDLLIEVNKWVVKELVSRDGKSKLKSEVYAASIDQRSKEAAGEAACSAVAVVMAHWFYANPKLINPLGMDFDSLITQGSSLWQSLCYEESYLRSFPNKHFDLETIVSANLRPIRICSDKSFTGFFSPEKFASLEGLMSFDQIWDEVEKEVTFASGKIKVYIISWNDHFFVVRADLNSYCVIDSLGERLFEGCNQAYILKFDDSSVMYEKEESSEKLVCEGKDCCREYIKRFLASVPVTELAEIESKGNVVDVSLLHEKLQIDLHHIMLTNDD